MQTTALNSYVEYYRPEYKLNILFRNLAPNPTHPNVAKQKELHKESFLFISQALKIDETETTLENKSAAIPLYEKGIEALKLGVNLYIPVLI